MQEEKETFRAFLRRTDDLAVRLGKKTEDLPELLGISRASLFGYRSGKRNITGKAWSKLEAAERAAGISLEPKEPDRNSLPKDPAETEKEREEIARLEKEIKSLHSKMDRILEWLDDHKKI